MLGYEPSDAKVMECLHLYSQSDVMDYNWVDMKVIVTSSTLSTEVALSDANIVVGDPSGGQSFRC